MEYELTTDEIRLLHSALSEYRERSGERGYSEIPRKAEELRDRLVRESPLERDGFRLEVPA